MGTIEPAPGQPHAQTPAGRGSSSGLSPWRLALLALAAMAAFLWIRRPDRLPAVALPSAHTDGPQAAAAETAIRCGGSKGCLVVYVAPWCGPCRSSLPGDVALADYVAPLGYETIFVVGMDEVGDCVEMARSIGRPARLDADGRWAKAAKVRGVPHFLVTTPTGKIVRRQAGAYLAPPDEAARLLGIS